MKLHRVRLEVERQAENERVRREAQFPLSIAEYTNLESKAAQLRIARFLMHNAVMRERMRTESGWAWRQTEPLIAAYNKNVSVRRGCDQCLGC